MTTPDDLRARLLAAADECAKDAPLLREAIAALSALPAAGGEDYVDADEVFLSQGTDDVPCLQVPGRILVRFIPGSWDSAYNLFSGNTPTTPQPSAAEGALLTNPHTGTPRDYRDVESDPEGVLIRAPGEPLKAAVGAQGDGELAWQNIENAEAEFLRNLADKGGLQPLVSGMLRHCARLLDRSAAPAAGKEEISPEFTDSARAAIAWVLYHHQGGNSAIGQPLRFALGMGNHEPLPEWRIAEAKAWAEVCGETENFRREAALTRQPVAGDGIDDATVSRASEHYLTARHNQVGHHDAFRSALQVALCAQHGGQ